MAELPDEYFRQIEKAICPHCGHTTLVNSPEGQYRILVSKNIDNELVLQLFGAGSPAVKELNRIYAEEELGERIKQGKGSWTLNALNKRLLYQEGFILHSHTCRNCKKEFFTINKYFPEFLDRTKGK